jgi:hypothetical protein
MFADPNLMFTLHSRALRLHAEVTGSVDDDDMNGVRPLLADAVHYRLVEAVSNDPCAVAGDFFWMGAILDISKSTLQFELKQGRLAVTRESEEKLKLVELYCKEVLFLRSSDFIAPPSTSMFEFDTAQT